MVSINLEGPEASREQVTRVRVRASIVRAGILCEAQTEEPGNPLEGKLTVAVP